MSSGNKLGVTYFEGAQLGSSDSLNIKAAKDEHFLDIIDVSEDGNIILYIRETFTTQPRVPGCRNFKVFSSDFKTSAEISNCESAYFIGDKIRVKRKVGKERKYGIYDCNGTLLVPFEYDGFHMGKNGKLYGRKDVTGQKHLSESFFNQLIPKEKLEAREKLMDEDRYVFNDNFEASKLEFFDEGFSRIEKTRLDAGSVTFYRNPKTNFVEVKDSNDKIILNFDRNTLPKSLLTTGFFEFLGTYGPFFIIGSQDRDKIAIFDDRGNQVTEPIFLACADGCRRLSYDGNGNVYILHSAESESTASNGEVIKFELGRFYKTLLQKELNIFEVDGKKYFSEKSSLLEDLKKENKGISFSELLKSNLVEVTDLTDSTVSIQGKIFNKKLLKIR